MTTSAERPRTSGASAGNGDAPRRVGGTDDFAQVAADFFRVGIDGAYDFDGLLLAHELRDGRPDGTDTILYGANFLLHVVLRSNGEA